MKISTNISKSLGFIVFCFILYHSIPITAAPYPENSISYAGSNGQSCNEYPAVSELENKILGRNFQNDEIYNRLNRLETNAFGSVFPQDSLYDRMERLKRLVANNNRNSNSYEAFNDNGNQVIFSSGFEELNSSYTSNSWQNNQNGYGSIWDILSNILMTPPGNYHHNYGSYSPEMINEMNRFNNSQFGTGVRIID